MEELLGQKFNLYLEQLNNESDRGAVIVAAAYIDELLSDLISSYLSLSQQHANELLTGKYAPLGSFSSRILLTRVLGLIEGSEVSCINTIRKIRNEFAHEIDRTFDAIPISDMCDSMLGKIPLYLSTDPSRREVFLNTAAAIIGGLIQVEKNIRDFGISAKYPYVVKLLP